MISVMVYSFYRYVKKVSFQTGQQKIDNFCHNILTEYFSESNLNQPANGIYKQNQTIQIKKTCSLTCTKIFDDHLRSGREKNKRILLKNLIESERSCLKCI